MTTEVAIEPEDFIPDLMMRSFERNPYTTIYEFLKALRKSWAMDMSLPPIMHFDTFDCHDVGLTNEILSRQTCCKSVAPDGGLQLVLERLRRML